MSRAIPQREPPYPKVHKTGRAIPQREPLEFPAGADPGLRRQTLQGALAEELPGPLKEQLMKTLIFVLVSIAAVSCVSSQAHPNEGNTAKITGMVHIYGNEPFTFVGIVDRDSTEYAVYPASLEAELRRLQGHLIEFTVVFLDEPQGYGSLFLKGGTVTPLSWEIIQ